MAKAKKTIQVQEIITMANSMLDNSADANVQGREAVFNFVADILHRTGNYRGFTYTEKESDLHAGFLGKDARVRLF